ncbi:MAG: hypothetical protein M3471_06265, partial [Actinomycetota bacterium]|nr:hypothetical protein [Actinomycetota bacterium]
MRERWDDTWVLLGMGWRVDRRLTASYLATMSLVTVAATIRALWFKLVIDAVTAGRLNQALAWAAVLAVSDAARSWGRVRSQMDQQDVHDRSMQFFQAEAMRLSGQVATVEHHELAEHIDRLSVLRSSFRTLSTALAAVVEGIMTVVRTVVTFVLLASVHPALLLLPLFALPSL